MQTNMIKKPEILSPAGNLEKLIYAVNYGADAVYCALDRFGMRSAADNFTPDELKEGIAYAHAHNAKLYLTLNTMPKDAELAVLPEYLRIAEELKPDAYIVSDPGVLEYLKEYIPDAVIHLSTQANTLNAAACRFWHKNGVQRIVLARELSLSDIKRIRANTPPELELECFVHGAMCVSYSGRCLLSNYYVNRNANNGACAQPCRWKYYLTEEKRPGEYFPVVENERGTFIFNSKDLCMIRHIPELMQSGISSMKIEGRVKSSFYVATVVKAYREAIDAYYSDKPYEYREEWFEEVTKVSNRDFTTGFFFGRPHQRACALLVVRPREALHVLHLVEVLVGEAEGIEHAHGVGNALCERAAAHVAAELAVERFGAVEVGCLVTGDPEFCERTPIESVGEHHDHHVQAGNAQVVRVEQPDHQESPLVVAGTPGGGQSESRWRSCSFHRSSSA